MKPIDNAILALSYALCAMGFLMFNLLREQWYDATFDGLVMLAAAAYVLRFLATHSLPQARRTRSISSRENRVRPSKDPPHWSVRWFDQGVQNWSTMPR